MLEGPVDVGGEERRVLEEAQQAEVADEADDQPEDNSGRSSMTGY
jgi:hypothetical protein